MLGATEAAQQHNVLSLLVLPTFIFYLLRVLPCLLYVVLLAYTRMIGVLVYQRPIIRVALYHGPVIGVQQQTDSSCDSMAHYSKAPKYITSDILGGTFHIFFSTQDCHLSVHVQSSSHFIDIEEHCLFNRDPLCIEIQYEYPVVVVYSYIKLYMYRKSRER